MGTFGLPFKAGRFRAQTDRVLIGTRSVVQPANAGAGAEWVQKVPGGQLWRVICGMGILTVTGAGATGTGYQITVDGVQVFKYADNSTPAASSANNVSYINSGSGIAFTGLTAGDLITIPSVWMPEGAVFGSVSVPLANVVSWTAVALYVERQYVTDQELNDVALNLQREELAIEKELQQGADAQIGL